MEIVMFDIETLRRTAGRAATLTAFLAATMTPQISAADHASYLDEVLPIFQKHCTECHQPGEEGYEKSGLDLRTYEGVMKGTKFGPIVIPGDAFNSNLLVLIEGRASGQIKMPHGGRKDLSRWEKVILRRWINRGAQNN